MLRRLAAGDDWGPPDPGALRIRPRFRLRAWTLGLELVQPRPGGEDVTAEVGLRLPPRKRAPGPRATR